MDKEYKWLVCTRCFTYNHAPYIKDAMNGFAMQETMFPVVTLIVDDASTDGEQEVILEYLKENFDDPYRDKETEYARIICAKHHTNQNCMFVVFLLKYNHHSIKKPKMAYLSEWVDNAKYHALCEGDDYWVDSLKLQKQASFLENKSEYGLVYTNHYNRRGDNISKFKEKGYVKFDDLLMNSGIGTLTACFRTELFKNYLNDVKPFKKSWLMGDAPMWKYMSYYSKVYFSPDYTSVYRILENSASHSSNSDKCIAFINSGYDIRNYFIERYVSDPCKRNRLFAESESILIRSIFNILYDHNESDRIRLYMKGKWCRLNLKYRVKLSVKYLLLFLNNRVFDL